MRIEVHASMPYLQLLPRVGTWDNIQPLVGAVLSCTQSTVVKVPARGQP